MITIVQLCGTNGSGKTWLARQLLTTLDLTAHFRLPLLEPPPGKAMVLKVPFGYTNDRVALVGRYDRPCGGADTIKTQDELCARVQYYTDRALRIAAGASYYQGVVFEGLLSGGLFQRYLDLDRALTRPGAVRFIHAFLSTPTDVCIARVLQRRQAAGNDTAFDPAKTMLPKVRQVQGKRDKLLRAGRDVRAIAADEAGVAQLLGWLLEGA